MFPLILYHLYSSLLNRIPTYFLQYLSFIAFDVSFVSVSSHSLSSLLIPSQSHPYLFIVTYVLCFFPASFVSVSSPSLSSLLIPSQSHPYLFLVTYVLCFFSCFVCLCLLSFSIMSTHPFSIASLLMSCSIFLLFLFVFRLSLSPLILYRLYSSLLNRTPTNFCDIFPLFLFVFHLSLSPLILYHLYSSFSIASLVMSCSIFPLFLVVFHLSLSPLILYHLYSSLLNRIPTYFL